MSHATRPSGRNTYRVSLSLNQYGNLADLVQALHERPTTDDGVRVILDPGHYAISDTLDLDFPFPVRFEGSGINNTFLEAAPGLEGKPMIIVRSGVDINKLTMDGSTLSGWSESDDAILLTFPGDATPCYNELTDFRMKGAARGICCKNSSEFFVFNFIMEDMRQVGIGFACDGAPSASSTEAQGAMDVEIGNFVNCGVGINLYAGTGVDVFVDTCRFLNEDGQVAINYNPDAFSYSRFIVSGCDFNEVGTFVAGTDFTLARDADIKLSHNTGVPGAYANAYLMVQDISSETVCSSTNSWYPVVMGTPTTDLIKFAVSDTELEYLPSQTVDLDMLISLNLAAGAQPRTVEVGIMKNGSTLVSSFALRITASGVPMLMMFSKRLFAVHRGDKFKLMYRCPSHSNLTVTTYDISWRLVSVE